MPASMDEVMAAIEHLLDDFDQIARSAFAKYRGYPTDVLVEHDTRAAASCTYCHMVSEADRRFIDRPGINPLEIRGLKVWLVADKVVIRFKKMDEDGRTRNYPTRQALKFDRGESLPGLPPPATRLAVGYLLDLTQTEFVRTQIAKPSGRATIDWCTAVVPPSAPGERRWQDVTRQGRFGGK